MRTRTCSTAAVVLVAAAAAALLAGCGTTVDPAKRTGSSLPPTVTSATAAPDSADDAMWKRCVASTLGVLSEFGTDFMSDDQLSSVAAGIVGRPITNGSDTARGDVMGAWGNARTLWMTSLGGRLTTPPQDQPMVVSSIEGDCGQLVADETGNHYMTPAQRKHLEENPPTPSPQASDETGPTDWVGAAYQAQDPTELPPGDRFVAFAGGEACQAAFTRKAAARLVGAMVGASNAERGDILAPYKHDPRLALLVMMIRAVDSRVADQGNAAGKAAVAAVTTKDALYLACSELTQTG